MIDKEKYEEARNIIFEYENQMNSSLVEDRICCVCKDTKVKAIHKETLDPLKQEQGMWSNGVVERITFGYGSVHDMESYYLAICNRCIVDLEVKKFATNIRDVRKSVKDYDAIINKIESAETNFNEKETRHLAVNFAINCQKGYDGTFELWYSQISTSWREIANR